MTKRLADLHRRQLLKGAGSLWLLSVTPVAAPLAQVDPRTFLMAVMNDPAVAIGDRIRAAQALLAAPPA